MTDIVRCSSAELFRVNALNDDYAYAMDKDYGVLEDQAERIAAALITTLGQLGINPEKVLFSGYSKNYPKTANAISADAEERLRQTVREANRLQTEGVFIDNPAIKQEYVERVAATKDEINAARDGRNTFYLNDVDGLYDSSSKWTNPIHFAGTGEGAVIAVYDSETLKAIGLSKVAANVVHTTQGELETAKVMEFYPRFKIV